MTASPDHQPDRDNSVVETLLKLAEAYQPPEFRANLKLWASGFLAMSLWIVLGNIAWNQFTSSKEFAGKLTTVSVAIENGKLSTKNEEQVKLIEKANNMVDSTANRLFTFLTPVVTAITGYFFVSAGAPALRASPASQPSRANEPPAALKRSP